MLDSRRSGLARRPAGDARGRGVRARRRSRARCVVRASRATSKADPANELAGQHRRPWREPTGGASRAAAGRPKLIKPKPDEPANNSKVVELDKFRKKVQSGESRRCKCQELHRPGRIREANWLGQSSNDRHIPRRRADLRLPMACPISRRMRGTPPNMRMARRPGRSWPDWRHDDPNEGNRKGEHRCLGAIRVRRRSQRRRGRRSLGAGAVREARISSPTWRSS